MNSLERLLAIVAPHTCLNCGREGNLLCAWCRPEACPRLPSRCYRCKRATTESAVCEKCRPASRLRHVWIATDYEGLAKQLVHKLKFERAQSVAPVIAGFMAETLPYLGSQVVLVPVPAATSRIRQRGYDQSRLLAKELAKELGVTYASLLSRLTQIRQVGSKRADRLTQLSGAFRAVKPYQIAGQHIVLVDDVTTTGATLEEAARTLRRAGARTVNAVVFAQTE